MATSFTGNVNSHVTAWATDLGKFSSCEGGRAVVTQSLPTDLGLDSRFTCGKQSSRVQNGKTIYTYKMSLTLFGTPVREGTFTIKYSYYRTGYNDRGRLVEESPCSSTFTVYIKPSKINITTESLPDGTNSVPYNVGLEATGTVPITWSVTGGELPPGLELNQETGIISGVPACSKEDVAAR